MKHKIRRRENDLKIRYEEFLNHAIQIALKRGYQNVTRKEIALRAKSSEALVSRYFGKMEKLKKEILKKALKDEILPIIAQGVSKNDIKINSTLKEKLIEFLSK